MIMASSEFQSNVNTLLIKIDAALSLWNNCSSSVHTVAESNSTFSSFDAMLDLYHSEIAMAPNKLYYHTQFIASDFPFHDLILRSKILEDEKLFEAVLYSKIFENKSEFEANRAKYEGELVWVQRNVNLILVSQNRIIYHMRRSVLNKVRESMQKTWAILKKKVTNNLIAAFGMPEPIIQDWESSHDAAVSCNLSSSTFPDTHQIRFPVTDEVRKILLDELNSFNNLDPRIKRRFVFDLKVLADKDLCYWRERLDCLRFSSNTAAVSASEPRELKRLSQAIENLEQKMVARQRFETSLAPPAKNFRIDETSDSQFCSKQSQSLSGTISRLEEIIENHINSNKKIENYNKVGVGHAAERKMMYEEIKLNRENLQLLVKSISTLKETVNCNEFLLAKLSEQKKDESSDRASVQEVLHCLLQVLQEVGISVRLLNKRWDLVCCTGKWSDAVQC